MVICPNCKSKNIGIIAPEHYYCWGCFIEMKQTGDRLDLYQVEEDGSLSSLNDLFYEDIHFEVVADADANMAKMHNVSSKETVGVSGTNLANV